MARNDASKRGMDFVQELHEKHGLLEAYRMAGDYLAMQERRGLGGAWRDTDEEAFCHGIRDGMRRLDAI